MLVIPMISMDGPWMPGNRCNRAGDGKRGVFTPLWLVLVLGGGGGHGSQMIRSCEKGSHYHQSRGVSHANGITSYAFAGAAVAAEPQA